MKVTSKRPPKRTNYAEHREDITMNCKIVFSALTLLFLVGCSLGADTIQDLKNNYVYHKQIVLNKPLEEAFKLTKDMAEQGKPVMKSILYSTHGEIYFQAHVGSAGYVFYCELTSVDKNTTKINFYAFYNTWKSAIDDWANRLLSM